MSVEKQIEWLREDIHKVDKKVDHNYRDLNKKMDDVLQFKWKVLGGNAVVHVVLGILIQIALTIWVKGT
jgi:ElaB/YqjD/DUF883 family membrane-anchored ribosome-binding protein